MFLTPVCSMVHLYRLDVLLYSRRFLRHIVAVIVLAPDHEQDFHLSHRVSTIFRISFRSPSSATTRVTIALSISNPHAAICSVEMRSYVTDTSWSSRTYVVTSFACLPSSAGAGCADGERCDDALSCARCAKCGDKIGSNRGQLYLPPMVDAL